MEEKAKIKVNQLDENNSNYNDEPLSQLNEFYNKFSAVLNLNKSIISIVDMIILDKDCIIALDNMGIINVWFIDKLIFSYQNSNNDELNEFSDYKTLYCNAVFDLKKTIVMNNRTAKFDSDNYNYDSINKRIQFSQMEKINGEYLIICGDFDTFLIKLDQLENKLRHLLKSNNSLKIPINSLDLEFSLKDFSNSDYSMINGIDADHENSKFITFSDNGNLFIYDLGSFELIKKISIDDFPQLKISKTSSSIICAKILPHYNLICIGTSEGNLNFMDYNNFNHIGFLNVSLNKYFNQKDFSNLEFENNLIEIENLQVINCLTSTTNYLLVGCNNFAFKFNIDLRIITQVFPSYGEVNAIAKQFNNEIYIGCNCNRLLKYNSNGKLISELKVSSYCIQNVMYMNIFNRKLICCSGISNYIDFIADDIILRLIF